MTSISDTFVFRGCVLVRVPAPPSQELNAGLIKPEPGRRVAADAAQTRAAAPAPAGQRENAPRLVTIA
jgi:hypothetical protein